MLQISKYLPSVLCSTCSSLLVQVAIYNSDKHHRMNETTVATHAVDKQHKLGGICAHCHEDKTAKSTVHTSVRYTAVLDTKDVFDMCPCWHQG